MLIATDYCELEDEANSTVRHYLIDSWHRFVQKKYLPFIMPHIDQILPLIQQLLHAVFEASLLIQKKISSEDYLDLPESEKVSDLEIAADEPEAAINLMWALSIDYRSHIAPMSRVFVDYVIQVLQLNR